VPGCNQDEEGSGTRELANTGEGWFSVSRPPPPRPMFSLITHWFFRAHRFSDRGDLAARILIMGAPSEVSPKQLRERHIRVVKPD